MLEHFFQKNHTAGMIDQLGTWMEMFKQGDYSFANIDQPKKKVEYNDKFLGRPHVLNVLARGKRPYTLGESCH